MKWVEVPLPETPVTIYEVTCKICAEKYQQAFDDLRMQMERGGNREPGNWHEWATKSEGLDLEPFRPAPPSVIMQLVWFEGRRILRGECPVCGTTHWSERR
jgi:hypothetical protein